MLLSGCGVQYDLRMPETVTTSAAVRHTVGSFVGERGTALFEQSWRPEAASKAAFVLMHGLKDHSSRYEALATALVGSGVAVYAFDLRGHGRSAGRRVAVEEFDDYVADLTRFVELVRGREPGRPIFVFGHSMGGVIATLWAERHGHASDVAGVVLSAPALRLSVWPITMGVGALAGILLPSAPALNPANADFCQDPAVVKAMDADPLIHQGGGPASTVAELAKGIAAAWEGGRRFMAPLLIVHGDADTLTDPEGSMAFKRLAASKDKALLLPAGLWHDLWHEPGRERVIADVVAWTVARIPVGTAPTGP